MPKSVLFDKEETVAKVMKLFWRKGYNGTSVQDLVDATGLNRSSLYNTFGGKFELFQEALNRYKHSQKSYLECFLKGNTSPKAAIQSFFEATSKEITSKDQNDGCMISNCITEMGNVDNHVRSFLIENKNEMVETFELLIKQAQEAEEIDSTKNAKVLALFLYSNLLGIRTLSILDKDIKGVIDQVIKAL